MAQGAKPGEGGQLPGHKVDRLRRATSRLTTPGVGLVSPHHRTTTSTRSRISSGWIYDLPLCANPIARIGVEASSPRSASGAVFAAGMARRNADHVLISGHDGGTGASPLSWITCSRGIPWKSASRRIPADARARRPPLLSGFSRTGRSTQDAASSSPPLSSAPTRSASRRHRSSRAAA